MGWYHEPRVPQGEPALNEKDVWLEGGAIRFGHWDGSAWVVDRTIDETGGDSSWSGSPVDLLIAAEDWHEFASDAGSVPWMAAGWSPVATDIPRYRFLLDGRVEIRGKLIRTSESGSNIVFYLAGDYQVSGDVAIAASSTCQRYDASVSATENVAVEIAFDGQAVQAMLYPVSAEGDTVMFNGFAYTA